MSMNAKDRLAEILFWLCSIPSPTGEEKLLCDQLAQRFETLGFVVRRYGNSLVIPITRGEKVRWHIALVGHLDVVRTIHDAAPHIDGDRLYGPGSADMKSGLALMIDLVEHDLAVVNNIDLTLVFYAKEEGPFAENELQDVLEQDPELRKIDLAICMEPSDNKLSLGASGSIHATVIFEGKTSHSARPWQGENAIHKAGSFLTELAALRPIDTVIDGLTYRTVTSVTLAQGGKGRNVVPDEFCLNVNHRFAPSTSISEAQKQIENLVRGRARIEWLDLSPGALPHATHPLVMALNESGIEAVEPKQAWTDVARFDMIGVSAVNFGPGENAQAHQRNEWTSLQKLEQGRTILLNWLNRIQTMPR